MLYLEKRPDRKDFVASCFTAARAGGVTVPEVSSFIDALAAEGVLDEAAEKGRALIAESKALMAGAFAGALHNSYPEDRDLLLGLPDLIA